VSLADRVIVLREGRVALDLDIDLPRPRRAADRKAASLQLRILDASLGERTFPCTNITSSASAAISRARRGRARSVGEVLRQVETRRLGRVELFTSSMPARARRRHPQRGNLPSSPERVLSRSENADALVVATPVYKAAYTACSSISSTSSNRKLLEGRRVIPCSDRWLRSPRSGHRNHLRPLFAFFRARCHATASTPPTPTYRRRRYHRGDGRSGFAAVDQLEAWLAPRPRFGHGESHTSCLAMPTASRDVVIIGRLYGERASPSSSAAVCHAVRA